MPSTRSFHATVGIDPDRFAETRLRYRVAVLDPQTVGAHAGPVEEAERGWSLGDQILIDLPDGQTVPCRIVNITDEGTIQVVPEHEVVIGRP
jgi:hypothetical protein